MGCPLDTFWDDSPWKAQMYYKAYLQKQKADNTAAWLQGAYVYNAMAAVANNVLSKTKINYPEKPFDIFPKTEEEKRQEAEEERRKLVNSLDAWKKAFDAQKGNDING